MDKKIRGITIQFGADASPLEKALKDVEKTSSGLNGELRKVNKLLKFDPGNTTLLAQKQQILSESIENTQKKLTGLKQAQSEVEKMFKSGDIGEKEYREFQRTLEETEQSLKSYTTQVEKLNKESELSKSRLEEFSKKAESAGGKLTDTGKTLAPLSGAIAGVGLAGTKMSLDFEDAMAKVSTIADTTKVPISDLKKGIMDLSDQTGISAGEIADAVYNAISAGQKTENALDFVENATKLAKAGFADMGSALDVLTTIMNAYGLEAGEVNKVSDILIQTQNKGKTTVGELASTMGKVIPTAKANNVALEQVAAGYVKMTANGVATAESTTYMNSMLNELGKSGTKVSDLLKEKTGKSFSDLMEEGLSLADVLEIVSSGAEEQGLTFGDMFSSAEAAKAGLILLGDGAGDFNKTLQEMTESSGVTDGAFEKLETKSNTLKKGLNQFKNALIELGDTIMDVFGPTLQSVADSVESFSDWFSGLSDGTKKIIVVIGLILAAIGPILMIVGNMVIKFSALSGIIAGAGGAMAFLTGTLLPVIGIIAGVVAVITMVITVIKNWGAITDWLSEKWQTFKDWISGIWEGIAETIQNVWTAITDWLSEKWQAFKDWISGIWEGIAETIQNVWTGIKDFFQTIWDAIYSVIEVPLNLIKSIIEGVMYAIYAVIYTVWEVIKFALKAAWDWISSTASTVFTPIAEFFSGIWNTISTAASTAWETIKGALATAWDWIGQTASAVFTPIANFFSGVWNGIKDVAVNIWNTIKDTLGGIWGGIKDKATEIFSSLWKFIKEGFNSLKDTLGGIVSGIANGIISPIGNAINGVIKGVNWILDKVGSKKQFDLWEIPKFARGAAGLPEDTIGIVNDQKGSVYKELIVPPDGKPFIPEGRDVVLPMKKGTKILPADETKNLFSVLPHFASGIGDFFSGLWESVSSFTGNVLDYIQHPKKIVQIAIDKFTDLSGIVEPWLSVTTGAVNSVVDNITDFVKEIFDKELTVKYNASAGVEQWRGLAEKALRMTGQYSEANLQRLLYQMQTESGGNPNAINNWDSNAAAGIPSKGLMQVIDPTFRAYAMQGYNTNIYDPLSNMLASIRYAVATYGSLERAYRGVGYEEGIGSIDLSKLFSVPSLDIRYFKEGGILTKPRVFSTGHGIGVAGEGTQNEAIAPVQKLKEYIQDSILEILGSKNIEISIDMIGYMDGRAVAKGQAHYIQPMIEKKEKMQRWLRGDEKWGY